MYIRSIRIGFLFLLFVCSCATPAGKGQAPKKLNAENAKELFDKIVDEHSIGEIQIHEKVDDWNFNHGMWKPTTEEEADALLGKGEVLKRKLDVVEEVSKGWTVDSSGYDVAIRIDLTFREGCVLRKIMVISYTQGARLPPWLKPLPPKRVNTEQIRRPPPRPRKGAL
jgi:hypothetical protein